MRLLYAHADTFLGINQTNSVNCGDLHSFIHEKSAFVKETDIEKEEWIVQCSLVRLISGVDTCCLVLYVGSRGIYSKSATTLASLTTGFLITRLLLATLSVY